MTRDEIEQELLDHWRTAPDKDSVDFGVKIYNAALEEAAQIVFKHADQSDIIGELIRDLKISD